MYKVLWNHLDQNLKKAPAPAVFLALLTAGWSAAGILAGLLVCLELQTELMVKLTVILCAGGYAGLIPQYFIHNPSSCFAGIILLLLSATVSHNIAAIILISFICLYYRKEM